GRLWRCGGRGGGGDLGRLCYWWGRGPRSGGPSRGRCGAAGACQGNASARFSKSTLPRPQDPPGEPPMQGERGRGMATTSRITALVIVSIAACSSAPKGNGSAAGAGSSAA